MKGLLRHKKWLIAGGVLLGLLLVLVILNFTLFSLKDVEIDFKNQSTIFSDEAKESIAQNSAIKRGTSIFALNKKDIQDKLERDNPYLKVINIETVFPNKITIHCAEREETYAIRAGVNAGGNEEYFICDAEFKVLYTSTTQSPYQSKQTDPILFLGLEDYIEDNDHLVQPGEFLTFSFGQDILEELGRALLLNNKTVAEQRGLISRITLTSDIYPFTATRLPYFVIEDFNGFVTNIYKPDTLLAEKLQYMFATLSQVVYNPSVFYQKDLADGKITMEQIDENYYLDYNLQILENNNSELVIRLEKLNLAV